MQNIDADSVIAQECDENIRLDKLLQGHFPNYSRTYFQGLIDEGLVLVNGERVKKRQMLNSGDVVEIEFALTAEIPLEKENIPLDILYEDAFLIAINKPAGLVVHPGAGNPRHTFVNALLYHCEQLAAADSLRPGIVHRLDKDTTGVLLAAKTDETHQKLVELFASRRMHKEYVAITLGNPGNRIIDAPIGRHPVKRKEMAINPQGKNASTVVEVIHSGSTFSYVRLFPRTGRTHQLRVHLQSVGTPILGDSVYGNAKINQQYGVERQLLHAEKLQFTHPITHVPVELIAPLPEDMRRFVQLV